MRCLSVSLFFSSDPLIRFFSELHLLETRIGFEKCKNKFEVFRNIREKIFCQKAFAIFSFVNAKCDKKNVHARATLKRQISC